MVMRHEFMGIVEEIGKNINNLQVGDRVVVQFLIACGGCDFCQHDLPSGGENSNIENYAPEGGLITEKEGGMFGDAELYGGYKSDG
ncbi:alcohol dehydrogenase catalytic domain-containing protein [Chryseobacterium sp. TY4]